MACSNKTARQRYSKELAAYTFSQFSAACASLEQDEAAAFNHAFIDSGMWTVAFMMHTLHIQNLKYYF